MDDKTLADKVVALGVGSRLHETYLIDAFSLAPGQFVTDWRVAGALIERCQQVNIWREDNGTHSVRAWRDWLNDDAHQVDEMDSHARAVTEACVTALEES